MANLCNPFGDVSTGQRHSKAAAPRQTAAVLDFTNACLHTAGSRQAASHHLTGASHGGAIQHPG